MQIRPDMIRNVCMKNVCEIWEGLPDTFPDFSSEISTKQKKDNERYIRSVSKCFSKHMNRFPRAFSEHTEVVDIQSRARVGEMRKTFKWKRRMRRLIGHVLSKEKVLWIHEAMNSERMDIFIDEIESFLVLARSFAPELSVEDLGQAIRNYLVYMMFVMIKEGSPGLNTAAFGYSMLYPFTDNYIDSPVIPESEKAKYNQLIREVIEGKTVCADGQHQKKTCELLQMIESKYPRDRNTNLYVLLLAMQEAQEQSMRQFKSDVVLSAKELLNISLRKGGLSVLLDRFLVPIPVTEEELTFFFGFGFFLQLADDLQDIRHDSERGAQTLLTFNLRTEEEEKIVNKMFWLVYHLTNRYHSDDELFKQFILQNCYVLLYTSVIGSRAYLPEGYLENLEKYMPFTVVGWEKIKQKPLFGAELFSQKTMKAMIDVMVS